MSIRNANAGDCPGSVSETTTNQTPTVYQESETHMEIQDRIQNEAQRVQAAYEAFKAVYSTMTPPPVEAAYQQDNVWIKAALVVIVIASMIVSGSHTIPTFADGANLQNIIVGVAAFFMLEAAIVAMAFIRTQRHYRVERGEPQSLRWFILAGLVIALTVALLANVEYMLKRYGIVISDGFRLVILLGLAISAPALAFITGDILAMYAVLDRVQQRRHQEAHDERLRGWQDEMLKSWQANKGRWGGTVSVSVDRPSIGQADGQEKALLSVRTASDGQRTDSGHGFERKANAKDIVRQWLAEHPEDITAQVRELAARLNVGKSTISDVQREFRERT